MVRCLKALPLIKRVKDTQLNKIKVSHGTIVGKYNILDVEYT